VAGSEPAGEEDKEYDEGEVYEGGGSEFEDRDEDDRDL